MLPANLNKLVNLEHLDVSNNRLSQINQINCMPNLRILNLCGNQKLTRLPFELSTCDSLVELIFDADIVQYPPPNVSAQSTAEIVKFLLTSERADTMTNITGNGDGMQSNGHGRRSVEKTTSAINQGQHSVITDRKYQISVNFKMTFVVQFVINHFFFKFSASLH